MIVCPKCLSKLFSGRRYRVGNPWVVPARVLVYRIPGIKRFSVNDRCEVCGRERRILIEVDLERARPSRPVPIAVEVVE